MIEPCNFKLEIAEFLMSGTMANLSKQVSAVASDIGTYAAGFAGAGIGLYSVLWVVSFVMGSQNGDIFSFVSVPRMRGDEPNTIALNLNNQMCSSHMRG